MTFINVISNTTAACLYYNEGVMIDLRVCHFRNATHYICKNVLIHGDLFELAHTVKYTSIVALHTAF